MHSRNARFRSAARQLARQQHGAIATHQLRALADRGTVDRLLADDAWSKVCSGVYVVDGSPTTDEQLVTVGLLRAGPGAVLSHDTAMWLWGMPAGEPTPVHVTRMRGSNGVKVRADGLVPHETRKMPPGHITTIDGLLLVTPSRLVVDAAEVEPLGRVERWLDHLWSRRLLTHESVATVVGDLTSKGRRGPAVVRALLAQRGPDHIAPASSLESRVAQILRDAGIGLRGQVDIGGAAWIGRVDFKLTAHPIVVEVQSRRYHTSLTDRSADDRRFAALRAAGWIVVEVWEDDVWHHPERVVAAVRATIRSLRPPTPVLPA